MSNTVFLTGLPRSGSTLIANLLGNHPDIHATPSSPLAHIVGNIRETYSSDQFFMSQLDHNYDYLYKKLRKSTKAYIEAWQDEDAQVTIDKNRGWLHQIEVIKELYPEFKMIVTLRDLRHVYASMERRHRNTALIAPLGGGNFVDSRAAAFFDGDSGICGSALSALQNLRDVPNVIAGTDKQHLFFLRYEDLMANPQEVMSSLFNFVGVKDCKLDFDNIKQVTQESDSHYRFKYMHKIKSNLSPANQDLSDITPSVINEIAGRYSWYYRTYYPDAIQSVEEQQSQLNAQEIGTEENPPKYQNDQYNPDELTSLIDAGARQVGAEIPKAEETPKKKKSPRKKSAKKTAKKKSPRKVNDAVVTKEEPRDVEQLKAR